MSLVATLVSSPADPQVSDRLIARAAAALGADATAVLAPGIAADLALPAGLDRAEARRRLADVLAGEKVDHAVLPLADRAKRLLVADMDSTMIGQECIDELAAFVGLKDHVAAITERAMRGEIAFEPALRERVGLLKGLSVHVVDEVIASRITLTPGGREMIGTMRANGAYTALVSGGFTLFTGRIGARGRARGRLRHHPNSRAAEPVSARLHGEAAAPDHPYAGTGRPVGRATWRQLPAR